MYKIADKDVNPYDAVGGAGIKEHLSSIPALTALNIATGGPLPGRLAGGFGTLVALGQDNPEGDLKNYDAKSFIPGVSAYRDTLRDMIVDKKLSKGQSVRRYLLSERLGGLSTTALTTLTGATIGGIAGNSTDSGNPGATIGGALLGAGAGAAVGIGSNLIGYLVGLLRDRRTAREHAEYVQDDDYIPYNYLIPGVAGYNRGRRARMALASSINS